FGLARFRGRSRAALAFFATPDRQAERLQLAVEVRALEARALGDARHAAVLAREQLLEIHALEGFPRLAVGAIESDLRHTGMRAACGEGSLDVLQLDLFLEGGERKVLHDAFQLGKVSRPGVVAQGVQRRDGQAPPRAEAALDQLRQHQRGEIRNVLGELAQRRQAESELAEARAELRIEFVLLGKRAQVERGKGNDAYLVLLGAREEEVEVALLGAAEMRQVRDEEHSASRPAEQLA